jgi:prepilin-type N-terminal cleavage/methylation domain-containing protein
VHISQCYTRRYIGCLSGSLRAYPTGMKRTLRSYPTDRTRGGFTLLEVLVVMGMLGVIAVMSMGQISSYVRERNVAAAAATVRNDIQQAFAVAARNRRPVRISFATADTALRITDRENTVTFVRRGLGVGSGFMLGPSDVAFCASTCSDATVDVFPNGWASDTLTVTISKGAYSRGIHMSRSGLVTTR